MKSRTLALPLIVTILAIGCGEDTLLGPTASNIPIEESGKPVEMLEIEFLGGFIQGDLMPPLPPDPIRCWIELRLTNLGDKKLYGVRIPSADVYLVTTGELLGTIPLSTTWDGRLDPLESETVVVEKFMSTNYLFDPPCGQIVSLDISIRITGRESMIFTPPEIPFECTF